MTFFDVQKFFMLWGMYPESEDSSKDYYGDHINSKVIRNGINHCCHQKMLEEARRLWGDSFGNFAVSAINAQDDSFFLRPDTWMKLRIRFESYKG
jgi:hypothetical protein